MHKLASVLALSYPFLSVELFIQKVEKTILESVLETEKLTLSRRLQFLLACIDLELLIMLWTLPYGTVGLEETTWKWQTTHFIQSLCQIWKLTNKEDFIPRKHEWESNHQDRSEPPITMLDFWCIGNTYIHFERMQYKLWCMRLQRFKEGIKGTESSS